MGKIFMIVRNQDIYSTSYQSIIWECDLSKPGSGAVWVRHDFSQNILQKHPSILYSEHGYQLTLPSNWTGRYVNTASSPKQLFALYDGYNYCIPMDSRNNRYGFLFSISINPIIGSNAKQRYGNNVLGENNIYYFSVELAPNTAYAKDETAQSCFQALHSNIPDILKQFAKENHLILNPNYQLPA